MPAMQRTLNVYPVGGGTLSLDNTSSSGSFVMGYAAGGLIYRTTGGTAGDVTISFYCDPDDRGTQYQLVDSTGTPVTVAVAAGECVPLPDGLFAAGRVYLRTSGDAVCTVRIGHKS